MMQITLQGDSIRLHQRAFARLGVVALTAAAAAIIPATAANAAVPTHGCKYGSSTVIYQVSGSSGASWGNLPWDDAAYLWETKTDLAGVNPTASTSATPFIQLWWWNPGGHGALRTRQRVRHCAHLEQLRDGRAHEQLLRAQRDQVTVFLSARCGTRAGPPSRFQPQYVNHVLILGNVLRPEPAVQLRNYRTNVSRHCRNELEVLIEAY